MNYPFSLHKVNYVGVTQTMSLWVKERIWGYKCCISNAFSFSMHDTLNVSNSHGIENV